MRNWPDRFPDLVSPLTAWVQRIVQDKEPVDKGIELALRAIEMQKAAPAPPAGAVAAMPMMGPGGSITMNLGRLYALKGDKAKAIETIDGVAKEAGENVRILPQVAQAYIDVGAEDKALAIYGPEFFKKNIGNANALMSYTAFWGRAEKNLDSALEAGKKSVELTPTNPACWTTLAQVYLKLKNGAGSHQGGRQGARSGARGPEGSYSTGGGHDQKAGRRYKAIIGIKYGDTSLIFRDK